MNSGKTEIKTPSRTVDLVPFFTADSQFDLHNFPAVLNVTGICFDSRKVKPGNVFVCLSGTHADGNQFVQDAIKSGAACIVSQQNVQTEIPTVIVPDAFDTLAYLADYFYDHPSTKLRLIGVTGTSGKTTTTHLIEHIFNVCGKRTGLIGTLGSRMPGQTGYTDPDLTTPQSSDVHRFLYQMQEHDCSHACMEVSSHALMLGRVKGCEFATAVFTNISQDHLDFHKTMEAYTQAKLQLFVLLNHSRQANKTAVINLDDPVAKLFIDACGCDVRKLTYGINSDSDIKALSIAYDFAGTRVRLQTLSGEVEVSSKLVGSFNVYNLMAAIGVAIAEGITLENCVRAIDTFTGVPGRFEVVRSGKTDEPLCIVDHSHKPDALENVLKTARNLTPRDGRLIVVFGCGGDRDNTKRPKMGRIAEMLADSVIVTSDNPRSENPDAIIKEIVAGISDMSKIKVEADRAIAIQLAIDEAGTNDVVVMAGKGHETYQILADRKIEFDDRVKVLEALKLRSS